MFSFKVWFNTKIDQPIHKYLKIQNLDKYGSVVVNTEVLVYLGSYKITGFHKKNNNILYKNLSYEIIFLPIIVMYFLI